MVKQLKNNNSKKMYAAGGNVDKRYQPLKLSDIPKAVKTFMPEFQQKAIVGSEEHAEILDNLNAIVTGMPHIYQTERTPENDKIVYLHYFYAGSDWYIVEKDPEQEQLQAYGYVILNGDLQNSEWGYISIEEIKSTKVIELDFYFTPIKFGELRKTWEGEDEEETGDNTDYFQDQDYTYVGRPTQNNESLVLFASEPICKEWIRKITGTELFEPYYNSEEGKEVGPNEMVIGWYAKRLGVEDEKFLSKGEFLERFEYNNIEDEQGEEEIIIKPINEQEEKRERESEIKDEYEKKRQSLDEFFTPKWVAAIMYKLALRHGFDPSAENANIGEPSFGHGVFFDVAIENGVPENHLYGFEIFQANVDFVKNKYPLAHLVNQNFEYEFAKNDKALIRDGINKSVAFQDAKFTLFLGNPPYGYHKSPYSYLWDNDVQVRIEGFFLYLCLQKLEKNGLLVFIINSLWLYNKEKYNKQKEKIFQLGVLIDAYRLPSNTFVGENRDTSIATDIVVFRKK